MVLGKVGKSRAGSTCPCKWHDDGVFGAGEVGTCCQKASYQGVSCEQTSWYSCGDAGRVELASEHLQFIRGEYMCVCVCVCVFCSTMTFPQKEIYLSLVSRLKADVDVEGTCFSVL